MTYFTEGENWFDTPSQEALAYLAYKVRDLNGAVIEVGCWEGRSTIALANAIAPSTLLAVDTWAGSPGEITADLAAERDVYGTWKANIDEATAGNVVAHRMGWREFFADFTTPIRLLFIDAEHTYTEVYENILAARRHVVPGGIVCGDDVHHPPIQEAIFDLFPRESVKSLATLWWVEL